MPSWQGWLPWIIVSVVVILWTSSRSSRSASSDSWPGLDKAISITLYDDKPYGAVWDFQPLATGTGILVAAMLTALALRRRAGEFFAPSGAPSGRSGSRSSPSA